MTEPFSLVGKWEFSLLGGAKKYTLKVRRLQRGYLAVSQEDVLLIDGINLASLLRLGHAPEYIEVHRLVGFVEPASCRFLDEKSESS